MMSPTTITRSARNRATSASSRSLVGICENPAGCADQIVGNCVGDDARPGCLFLDVAISGPDQDAAAANPLRELDVEPPIADDEGSDRVDPESLGRPIDKGAAWLPAVAAFRVQRNGTVGVMRTIVIRVDVRAA